MPLIINIPSVELFDEEEERFITLKKDQELTLEHSLISVSKWESKWHTPYLHNKPEKTDEQVLDYVKCMTISKNVDPLTYRALTKDAIKQIADYINDPCTATTFSKMRKTSRSSEIFTSELMYYYMFKLGIPKECEKWHINRLITLFMIYEAKENNEKMSSSDILAQNRELNAQRRAVLKSKG